MSSLLIAPSGLAAQALADKAQAWLLASVARYDADKWCDPVQHPIDGRWAIAFEPRLAPAFTADERGDTPTPDGMGGTGTAWAHVIERTDDWNPPAESP